MASDPRFDERGPVGWQPSTNNPAIRALEEAGVVGEQLLVVLQALIDARLLVSAGYYIPTFAELRRDYNTLGEAYLNGRLMVRWVMCRETHDALMARYDQTRYPVPPRTPLASAAVDPSSEVLEFEVRTVMERNRRWTDPGMLFGVPIRIDPVARRPVFEIIEEGGAR